MKLAEVDETSRRIIDISMDVENRLVNLLRKLIPGDEASNRYKNLIFMSSVNYPTENEGIVDFGRSSLIERDQRIAYLKLLIKALKSI
ncbi:hypothetical protein D3C74_480250 [compost metagenome]